ncbi:hypothetical protein BS47DRAFT_1397621 [Hydnum rufescens UP504]|uniref:Uncharacterized protein n=1 Tax=Hydnum rufescens UP504 TaxID=1448309 RepID=A0A9P6AMK6_9AGAM|nr:hypothetical protein BS47DRAFT_1397621 [Hydnum rufescens UP504]
MARTWGTLPPGWREEYKGRAKTALVQTSSQLRFASIYLDATRVLTGSSDGDLGDNRRHPRSMLLVSYTESTSPVPITSPEIVQSPEYTDAFLAPERGETGKAHESAGNRELHYSPHLSGDTVSTHRGPSWDRIHCLTPSGNAIYSSIRPEEECPECKLYSVSISFSLSVPSIADYSQEKSSFFCAIILENLISAGNGANVSDTPTKFPAAFCSEDQGKNQKNLLAKEPPQVALPAPIEVQESSTDNEISTLGCLSPVVSPGGGINPAVPSDGHPGNDLRWPATFHGFPSTRRAALLPGALEASKSPSKRAGFIAKCGFNFDLDLTNDSNQSLLVAILQRAIEIPHAADNSRPARKRVYR